jgi:hypothetical protein
VSEGKRVPVSLRGEADAPGSGAGTGHWGRFADQLLDALSRCRVAVNGVPAGGMRDELDAVLHIVVLRAQRYVEIAEIGQALRPDDDTTVADGTKPGQPPLLLGAAGEIDERLRIAVDHLTEVAGAVERLAATIAGTTHDADRVAAELARLVNALPPA